MPGPRGPGSLRRSHKGSERCERQAGLRVGCFSSSSRSHRTVLRWIGERGVAASGALQKSVRRCLPRPGPAKACTSSRSALRACPSQADLRGAQLHRGARQRHAPCRSPMLAVAAVACGLAGRAGRRVGLGATRQRGLLSGYIKHQHALGQPWRAAARGHSSDASLLDHTWLRMHCVRRWAPGHGGAAPAVEGTGVVGGQRLAGLHRNFRRQAREPGLVASCGCSALEGFRTAR
mmetsp:Transcript_5436/g.22987  ORF Transcript_5436/g.22987 Transcript_5436/m.22987 type:complete len:234 (-) Transcript_5436:3344-4045(-)